MQYTLMHKNIAVADMELDEATSSIQRIDAVYRPEHLPVATASKRDGVDRAALNAWWIDRCIPASRSGVRKALETLNLPNTQVLLMFIIGLELKPSRLWAMRRDIFGLGLLQVVLCGLALTGVLLLLTSMTWQAALVVGLPLGLSSTALVMPPMASTCSIRSHAFSARSFVRLST